jgi:hypothetical protein
LPAGLIPLATSTLSSGRMPATVTLRAT